AKHRRLEADLYGEALSDLAPLRKLARSAARHMDRDDALEIALAVALCMLFQRLPPDAGLTHPVNGRVRLLDQRLRQLAVHAALRHAIEIGHELVGAVGRDGHGGKQRLVNLRNEAADFRPTRMHETKAGARIAGVAAIFG